MMMTSSEPPIHTSAPEVVALVARAFPEYKGRRFTLMTAEQVTLYDVHWCGGRRSSYRCLQIAEPGPARELRGAWASPWSPQSPEGAVVPLPPGVAMVEYREGEGAHESVVVYVRPDNLNRAWLPASVDLTRDERIVLTATRHLVSSYGGLRDYRFSEAERECGITRARWDAAKAGLIERRLLNKAGRHHGRRAKRHRLHDLRPVAARRRAGVTGEPPALRGPA